VDVALLYGSLQVGHCIIYGINFEFNNIISLYIQKTILGEVVQTAYDDTTKFI